jgi:hypothetical protein
MFTTPHAISYGCVYNEENYSQAWLGDMYVLVILAPHLARTAEGWCEPCAPPFELGLFFFPFCFWLFFFSERRALQDKAMRRQTYLEVV